MNSGRWPGCENAVVLIIGAGPAGLAVARCLSERGVSAMIVDRSGQPGGAYRRMYANLALSSPARYLSLPGRTFSAANNSATARDFAMYLEDYAKRNRTVIEPGEVIGLASSVDGVSASFKNGQTASFAKVVIATGMCDHPVWPAIPGLKAESESPSVLHAQDWPGPNCFRGKRLLIVGDGMRAVEIAEECVAARISPMVSAYGAQVHTYSPSIFGWDARHLTFLLMHYIPTRFFRSRCAAGVRFKGIDQGFRTFVSDNRIRILPEIAEINGTEVSFVNSFSADVDAIVLATGYRYAMPFLPESVRRGRKGTPLVIRGQCRTLPNVHFVGFPCAFRWDSQFIHGIATDARLVATEIARSLRVTRQTVRSPGGS